MLARVKKPRIEMRGELTDEFLDMTRKHFGAEQVSVIDEDELLVAVEDSDWYRNMTVTPGEAMKIYRENHGLTQEKLGAKLGGIARGEISKMETGKRNISIKTARKLAKLFDVPVARFII